MEEDADGDLYDARDHEPNDSDDAHGAGGVGALDWRSREQGEAKQSQAQPTRTGKERLGGKASDDQRTDNCNVPPDLRGPKPRPTAAATGRV